MADKAKEKTETFLSEFLALTKKHFGSAKEIFKTLKAKDGQEYKYQFADVKTKDGANISYDGDMPMEGMPIYVIPSDGSEPVPPADGVLLIEDGTEIEVKGGVITAVKLPAGAAPTPEGDMNTPKQISATEEAAIKKTIESTIKETVYSKQEVSDMLDKQKTEFEAQVKAVSEKFDAVTSANETLTKKLGEVSAKNAELETEVGKFKSFSTQLPELLKEYGAEPQVQETEEEKKKKAEAFKSEPKPKMTREEWQKRFMPQ